MPDSLHRRTDTCPTMTRPGTCDQLTIPLGQQQRPLSESSQPRVGALKRPDVSMSMCSAIKLGCAILTPRRRYGVEIPQHSSPYDSQVVEPGLPKPARPQRPRRAAPKLACPTGSGAGRSSVVIVALHGAKPGQRPEILSEVARCLSWWPGGRCAQCRQAMAARFAVAAQSMSCV
jgi:hypothetical protein